jgi:hypothetical protein
MCRALPVLAAATGWLRWEAVAQGTAELSMA